MKIVVGYDGSEDADRAIERAVALAGPDGAVTVVDAVHVYPPVGRGGGAADYDERADAPAIVDKAYEKIAGRVGEARKVIGHGDPGKVLIAEAEEWGADLIVVGTRGQNAVARALLGSVSTYVVHHAPCDVLVAR
jgi:nucleotide-binding universal stress UspA family protein